MMSDVSYFYEDEVCRLNKKGNIEFGMVLQNAEFASSDDSSSCEDENRMKNGFIRVAWHPKGVEQVVRERKVKLSDRSIMPGDVVRKLIRGKDTQRGYCRRVTVLASVQIVDTKQVIHDVNSTDLRPLEEFCTDMVVCMDQWVGTIKMVKTKVHLKSLDGSRCIMDDIDAMSLDDVRNSRKKHSEFRRFDFYSGQQLWGPSRLFDNADWLHIGKETALLRKSNSGIRVEVEEIKTLSVGVHWQYKAHMNSAESSDCEMPAYLVQGESLKKIRMLNIFEPCTLQIGDHNHYILKQTDTLMSKEQWLRMEKKALFQSTVDDQIVNGNDHDACDNHGPRIEIDSPGAIAENHDMEEGSDQFEDIDSTDCDSQSDCSSRSSDSTEKANKRRKGRKGGPVLMTKVLKKQKLKKAVNKQFPAKVVNVKPGDLLVVETLTTHSTADIVWQDGTFEKGVPSAELYPIHHLDDQEFFPGDFVVDASHDVTSRIYGVIQKVNHSGRITNVSWYRTYVSISDGPKRPEYLGESEVSVYDLKDHPDFKYRPSTVVIKVTNFDEESKVEQEQEEMPPSLLAGQVLDNYTSGQVEVQWVSKQVSLCWPQDLFRVGDYDSDEGELWDDQDSVASWETESEQSFSNELVEEDVEKLRPKLGANIDLACAAMGELEGLFAQNPCLQTGSVMKQLLDVYKDCRYLDKLMCTRFFHESNFEGLIEKVKEKGKSSQQKPPDQQTGRIFLTSIQRRRGSIASALRSEYKKDDFGSAGLKDVPTPTQAISEKQPLPKLCEKCSSSNMEYMGITGEKPPTTDPPTICDNDRISRGLSELGKQLAETRELILPHVTNSANLAATTTDQSASSNNNNNCDIVPESPANLRLHPQKFQPSLTGNSAEDGGQFAQVCGRLCFLLRQQLLLVHKEVSRRFNDTKESESIEDSNCDCVDGIPVAVKNKNASKSEDSGFLNDCTMVNGYHDDSFQGFLVLESAPKSHKFHSSLHNYNRRSLFQTISKEYNLLKSSLPDGIWVRVYEDRMDLISLMICGPANTPYEDGLFLFDVQLSVDYPKTPPLCHYLSYCTDRLNPNLYEDGKVCISLLGTWSGKGTEVWMPDSSLLQVIVSIQGLILVREPYFNEAGYEKQHGTQQGKENSRMYNEMAILKLVQSTTKLMQYPPEIFKKEIEHHFRTRSKRFTDRLMFLLEISEKCNDTADSENKDNIEDLIKDFKKKSDLNCNSIPTDTQLIPEFPLIPGSRGFCISLRKMLDAYQRALTTSPFLCCGEDDKSGDCTKPVCPSILSTSDGTCDAKIVR